MPNNRRCWCCDEGYEDEECTCTNPPEWFDRSEDD
jgi:hypothetical protein